MHTPKITRLSSALAVILAVIFTVNYFVPSTAQYLALVPGRTLPCVWNLVTAGFLTTDIYTLAFNVLSLILLARIVEPVHGSKEFLKFLFIVDITTSLIVFISVYIAYAYSQSGQLLYTPFYGFHGIAAGLLVAVKQIMADQEAKLFGVIRLPIKLLPLLLILLVTAVAAVLRQYAYIPFLYIGAYSAWVYLRFFQQQRDGAAQGDASDAFKFSGFFPSLLAPVIDPLASLFSFIFRLRHPAPTEGQALQMKAGPSMLGADASDANRRRERGAKALEERLVMKKQGEEDVEQGSASAPAPAPTNSTASNFYKAAPLHK